MEKIVEKIMAKVDGMKIQEHKNLLGDKWKYINAIAAELPKDYIKKDSIENKLLLLNDDKEWGSSFEKYQNSCMSKGRLIKKIIKALSGADIIKEK